jgi:hypothetical protein
VKIDDWFPVHEAVLRMRARERAVTAAGSYWEWKACGADHDRDVNTRTNISTVGLAGAADAGEDSGGYRILSAETKRQRLDESGEHEFPQSLIGSKVKLCS